MDLRPTLRRNVINIIVLAVPATFALFAVAVFSRDLQTGRGDARTAVRAGVYDPDGYYELVNAEVAPLLRVCPLDRNELALVRPDLAGEDEARDARCEALCDRGRVSSLFCLADGLSQDVDRRVRHFIDLSPLVRDLDDLERWDWAKAAEGSAAAGRAGDQGIRLVPGKRRQALPAAWGSARFVGRVLYRDSQPLLALIDQGGNELLLAPSAKDPAATDPSSARHVLTLEHLLARQKRALEGAPPQRETVHARELRIVAGEDHVSILAPRRDTRVAVVAVPQRSAGDASALRIDLDGTTLGTASHRRLVSLQDGQELQVAGPGTALLTLRFVRRQSAVLSEFWQGGQHHRRHHDPVAGLDRYLDGLTGAITEAAGRALETADACAVDPQPVRDLLARDVRLTLDERLQHVAAGALQRYMEAGPPATAYPGIRFGRQKLDGLWLRAGAKGPVLTPPPHAALTVLDADSGELLAMASYPSTTSLEAMRERLSTVTGNQPVALAGQDLDRERAATSLQLRPHLIASIFKPMLAWAAGLLDPALLDVPVQRDHAVSWRSGPDGRLANGLVDQCLVPGAEGYFEQAFARPGSAVQGCPGATPSQPGREDVCTALGASDTYWFLHLAARMMARGRGRPLENAEADLAALCEPQHVHLGNSTVLACAGNAEVDAADWFGRICRGDASKPFCRVADLLDVHVQPIGEANPVLTGPSFLGPLHALLDRQFAGCEQACAGVEPWRKASVLGLRWVTWHQPQWSADLLKNCRLFTFFLEGGHINYWSNVAVVQALARIFSGKRVQARLVTALEDPHQPAGTPPAQPPTFETIAPVDCAVADTRPQCQVLHGLREAVEHGTLRGVLAAEKELERDRQRKSAQAGGADLPSIRLIGKTGTGRVPYAIYERTPKAPARWQRRTGKAKSAHTALLVAADRPGGTLRTRRFVVYLWLEGIDDQFTSVTGAAPFFHPNGPGLEVLRALRTLAHAGAEARP